ncbi:MAG TPA: TlpA disulfide reductase family protein [Pyrinomonadaceae bacterium]|jgi:thiol-disulfide isomerase/thioredoxin|nr:TlpA disulfide reductase family protein [Pyrinomonadaceae bacterium]
MQRSVFASFLLATLAVLLSFSSFAQTKRIKGSNAMPPPGYDFASESQKFLDKFWARRIVKCGGSSYFMRTDAVDGRTLVEATGVTFETAGESAKGREGYPRDLFWSGISTAKFERHRKMTEAEKTWGEWKEGGSDSTYYQFDKGNWSSLWSTQIYTSCAQVDMFTGKIGVGKILPDYILKTELRTPAGDTFTLEKYKGIVLLNLWATWCAPCRLEMPALNELQEKYRGRGITVIGLDVESEDTKEMIETFREMREVKYILVTGDVNLTQALMAITRMQGIPQSFIIVDGKLVGVFKGHNPNRTINDMSQMIEANLDAK